MDLAANREDEAMTVCPCGDWAAHEDDEIEMPDEIDEIVDLVAEAARVSPYARSAYLRLRDLYPALPLLEQRQRLIAGRMKGVA